MFQFLKPLGCTCRCGSRARSVGPNAPPSGGAAPEAQLPLNTPVPASRPREPRAPARSAGTSPPALAGTPSGPAPTGGPARGALPPGRAAAGAAAGGAPGVGPEPRILALQAPERPPQPRAATSARASLAPSTHPTPPRAPPSLRGGGVTQHSPSGEKRPRGRAPPAQAPRRPGHRSPRAAPATHRELCRSHRPRAPSGPRERGDLGCPQRGAAPQSRSPQPHGPSSSETQARSSARPPDPAVGARSSPARDVTQHPEKRPHSRQPITGRPATEGGTRAEGRG